MPVPGLFQVACRDNGLYLLCEAGRLRTAEHYVV